MSDLIKFKTVSWTFLNWKKLYSFFLTSTLNLVTLGSIKWICIEKYLFLERERTLGINDLNLWKRLWLFLNELAFEKKEVLGEGLMSWRLYGWKWFVQALCVFSHKCAVWNCDILYVKIKFRSNQKRIQVDV